MNPLQQKCLFASAGMHSFLLVALVFGAAFRSREKVENITPTEIIAAADVERALRGRASVPPPPKAVVDPAPPAPVPVPPTPRIEIVRPTLPTPPIPPTPPKITPKPVEVKKVSPVHVQLTEVVRPTHTTDIVSVKPTGPKTTVKVDLDTVKPRSGDRPKDTTSNKIKVNDLAAAQHTQAVSRVNDALAQLQKTLAQPITVTPRDGSTDEATVDFGALVATMYQNAWIVPNGVADSGVVAEATVRIGRDGSVIEARLTRSSGRAALDKSIESALRGVKFIGPFPPSDREKERTFIIDFNLKAKRLLG